MTPSFVRAWVRGLIATFGISLAGVASASPAVPVINDADQRCVSDHFKPTYELIQQGAVMREAIESELEKSTPDWAKLRRMIVKMQANDMHFRSEMHRVELMCLDKISAADRISSLRFEFRKMDPPPITVPKSR